MEVMLVTIRRRHRHLPVTLQGCFILSVQMMVPHFNPYIIYHFVGDSRLMQMNIVFSLVLLVLRGECTALQQVNAGMFRVVFFNPVTHIIGELEPEIKVGIV